MLVFSAMAWQISEGFLKLTQDINTAKNLYIIAQAGSLIVIASCLYFSLIFTKFIVNMKSSLVSFFIFFPAIFFIISNILQWTNTEFTYSSSYGFLNTTDSTIYSLESLYISICGIATTLLLINFWIKQKDARSGLFAVGFLIPFIQGLITEIIFPELLDIPPIPLTTATITIFSIASIIALKKYNLLSFSPYKVSDSIINNMSDALLISDNNGVIKYVNPSLLKLLSYKNEDLIDKRGEFLLADNESEEKISLTIEGIQEKKNEHYEINLSTKDGNIINAILSSSPYYQNNKIIGALLIFHDITNEKEQVKKLTAAMISGEEKERQRLAFELHDGISQSIAGINMKLQSLKSVIIVKENDFILDDIIQSTKESITEIRNISHNLYPLNEDDFICDAITKLIGRHKNIPLKFVLNVAGNKPLSNNLTITTNVYRVVQEFINNSIKYAQAKTITIDIIHNKYSMTLEIGDDGIGFDLNSINQNNGIGLNNMEQRIKIIGGSFNLTSEVNIGTKLVLNVPS